MPFLSVVSDGMQAYRGGFVFLFPHRGRGMNHIILFLKYLIYKQHRKSQELHCLFIGMWGNIKF
jgi:hypothetical protein